MTDLNFDLDEYPTLKAAAQSNALVRTIRGPAGSAKTSWSFVELLRRACEQEPAADGVRYTRWLVGRLTYQVLTSATLETARKTLGSLINFRDSIPPNGKTRFGLADGTIVNTEFEFLSLDGEDAATKLLGYEPTGALLDEISEMPESIVHAVLRRIGRYPANTLGMPTWHGIIGVTNGPIEGHWLQEWELGKNKELLGELGAQLGGRPFFHAFQQPPALIRPADKGGKWKPNPKAENVKNLSGGYAYYYAMLADPDDAKIKAFVEGEFAPLKTGTLVFPEFNRERHVAKMGDVRVPSGIPLGLSFDFGRTPVCGVWVESSSGRLIQIEEVMMEDASVETLATEGLLPLLRKHYPGSKIEWATGDPAGEIRGQQVDTSPYEVLWELGIPIENPGGANKLSPRLEAVKQRLNRLEHGGFAMLQIRENCTFTIEALSRTYIFEKVATGRDTVRDTPTKSHVNWVSDLADQVQYAALYRPLSFATPKVQRDLPKLNTRWG